MDRNQFDYDEIQDQHLDAMIKLAFMYADTLEARKIMEECEDTKQPVDEECAQAAYAMFLDKLSKQEKQERKQSRITMFRRAAQRVVQIAACLILVVGIAAPIAVANVEAIRIKVMELLISIQEDHTELRFVENTDLEFCVPTAWQGMYYPSYMPDGFELKGISTFSCEATYSNTDGAFIYFGEYVGDDSVDINSENAKLSYTTINGMEAFVIERTESVILTWSTEDKFFVIIAHTSLDEARSIAQSVRRISFAE